MVIRQAAAISGHGERGAGYGEGLAKSSAGIVGMAAKGAEPHGDDVAGAPDDRAFGGLQRSLTEVFGMPEEFQRQVGLRIQFVSGHGHTLVFPFAGRGGSGSGRGGGSGGWRDGRRRGRGGSGAGVVDQQAGHA